MEVFNRVSAAGGAVQSMLTGAAGKDFEIGAFQGGTRGGVRHPGQDRSSQPQGRGDPLASGDQGQVSRVASQGEVVQVILPVVVDSLVEVLKGVCHLKTTVDLYKVEVLGRANVDRSFQRGSRSAAVGFLVEVLLPVVVVYPMVFLEVVSRADILEAFLVVVGQRIAWHQKGQQCPPMNSLHKSMDVVRHNSYCSYITKSPG